MKYSLIFPGQGAQRPGMGKDFFDNYASSKAVFDEADDVLGFSLSNLIFNGTPEELAKTSITQPAILTVSVAAYKALESEFGSELSPVFVAGHSLGEYSAHVAAGTLSVADGVKLVHLRGSLMQEAVPEGIGTMAAIIGLDYDTVKEICGNVSDGEVCQAANVNSPTQIVISGHVNAVNRAVECIQKMGNIRVVPLRVSAPFHCDLMKSAGEKLKAAFDEVKWNVPSCPVYANATAGAVMSVEDIRRTLYLQTFSPVLWCQSVLNMDSDIDGYIELGPGSVLSGLVRKITKEHKPYPVSDVKGLMKALAFLKGE